MRSHIVELRRALAADRGLQLAAEIRERAPVGLEEHHNAA